MFKGYRTPNGGIVLHDTTNNEAYLFADAAPVAVQSVKAFNGDLLTEAAVGAYELIPAADAVTAILPNIIQFGSPTEVALAKYLQEQTWDQVDQ